MRKFRKYLLGLIMSGLLVGCDTEVEHFTQQSNEMIIQESVLSDEAQEMSDCKNNNFIGCELTKLYF